MRTYFKPEEWETIKAVAAAAMKEFDLVSMRVTVRENGKLVTYHRYKGEGVWTRRGHA